MKSKHPLDRLLRLRSLLEDVSRVELESRLQELGQIEDALARLRTTAGTMRRQSFAGVAQARSEDRLEAEVIGEWVVWESGAFEKAGQKKTAEVDAAKEIYLERRKERRQVSSVIEAGDAVATMERNRREQRELDDWFGQRNRSGRDRTSPSA